MGTVSQITPLEPIVHTHELLFTKHSGGFVSPGAVLAYERAAMFNTQFDRRKFCTTATKATLGVSIGFCALRSELWAEEGGSSSGDDTGSGAGSISVAFVGADYPTYVVVSKGTMTALANKVKVSATFQTSDPDTISVKLTQNSDGKIKFAQTGGGTADDVTVQLSKSATSKEISVWGREASTGVDKKEVTATEVATGTTPARPGVSPATTKGTVLTGCDLQFEGEFYSPVNALFEFWRHSKEPHTVRYSPKGSASPIGPPYATLDDPDDVDDDETRAANAFNSLISFTKNEADQGGDNADVTHTRALVSTWETKINTAKSKSPVVDLTTVSDPIIDSFVAWTSGIFGSGYQGLDPIFAAVITYVDDPSSDTKTTYIEMNPKPPEDRVLRLKKETDDPPSLAEKTASTTRLTTAAAASLGTNGADLARYLTETAPYDTRSNNPRMDLWKAHYSTPSTLIPWSLMKECRSLHFAELTLPGTPPAASTWSTALFEITNWDKKSLAAKLIYAAQELASSGSTVTSANAFNCKLQKYDQWTLMGEVNDGTHETQ